MKPATLATLNMRELERVKVTAVVEGRLRCFQAAERLPPAAPGRLVSRRPFPARFF